MADKDMRKLIVTILKEIKMLEDKIEDIAYAAKYTGEVATSSISESLREVIKFSEDSTKKILDNMDKIYENSKLIEGFLKDLASLDLEAKYKDKLTLIKEKNDENKIFLSKAYELFSFQDLSSQQLNQVIKLLEDTKNKLIELAELSIENLNLPEDKKSEAVGKVHELLSGDRINQDEVDELLKELGL
ncbi:MAG: chemotaxis protein CheZ [Aquificaceae bacterium]